MIKSIDAQQFKKYWPEQTNKIELVTIDNVSLPTRVLIPPFCIIYDRNQHLGWYQEAIAEENK